MYVKTLSHVEMLFLVAKNIFVWHYCRNNSNNNKIILFGTPERKREMFDWEEIVMCTTARLMQVK